MGKQETSPESHSKPQPPQQEPHVGPLEASQKSDDVTSGKTSDGINYVETKMHTGAVRRDFFDGPSSVRPKQPQQPKQRPEHTGEASSVPYRG